MVKNVYFIYSLIFWVQVLRQVLKENYENNFNALDNLFSELYKK